MVQVAPPPEGDATAPLRYPTLPSRSSTARTSGGQATVASAYTSAKRPPSPWGTNFPQLTPSE